MTDYSDPDFNKPYGQMESVEQIHNDVIARSKERVMDHIEEDDQPYDLAEVVRLATAMLNSLMNDLGDLAQPLLRDKAWVAGFLAGIGTCESLALDDDVLAGVDVCPDGHTHHYIDLARYIAYTNVAAFGIIDGHELSRSTEGEV